MAYTLSNLATLEHMKELGTRVVSTIKPINQSVNKAIKNVVVNNRRLEFYTTANASGDPDFTFDLGEEQLLDQANTKFVPEFEFSSETYTGATDPNLNGRPVLVMAMKAVNGTETSIAYSFADLANLVKTYSAADQSIKIANNAISVKIADDSDNILKYTEDGLFVQKYDAAISGAREDNIAVFNGEGKLKDGGIAIATAEDVDAMLNDIGLFSANNTVPSDEANNNGGE